MRFWIAALAAMLIAGSPAHAANEPATGPVPAWVARSPVPAPDPALKERPLQALLLTAQARYGKDGTRDHYFEYATLVQTAQGLAAAGNIVIPWQPDAGELVLHKAQIIRSGKTIDLLAAQEFTVLRRENSLESAKLDGLLTAVMQPEGLAVGDILSVAWTVRLKPASFAPSAEDFLSLGRGLPIRRLRFREVWEAGLPLRWKASPALGNPKLTTTAAGSELDLELTDAVAPEPPASAPPRFTMPPTLEVSGYTDWAEISRLTRPLYAGAAKLDSGSPVRAEVSRLAAAHSEPRARALAALRLVQDRVRYFALAMGEGGYVPATADETWKRKYGDCKGKTTLLLALLAGLGIQAEPVLVSTSGGDALPERLPMLRMFDHVLVRATIGGRSYWLDGTRMGDRSLDDLASLPFGHVLPVTEAGSGLVAVEELPPTAPLHDVTIAYDASAGFSQLVPVKAEMKLRGELATAWRAALAEQGEEALREALQRMIPRVPNEDLGAATVKDDADGSELTVAFEGRTRMHWNQAPASRSAAFRFDDDVIQWAPDLKRADGPLKDAPFSFEFPLYIRLQEIVQLPRGGAGFSLQAGEVDETVGGVHIFRSVSLKGDRAMAVSSFRRLRREIPAAEMRAAERSLARINEKRALILAPADYRPDAAEIAALRKETPRNYDEYLDRGFRLMGEGNAKAALADFDKAVELSPELSVGHANRGVALVHLERLDEAEQALQRALELDADEFVVHQGFGMLHMARDRPEEAVAAFTRSLKYEAENGFTLASRAYANASIGRLREALADMERVLAKDPDSRAALWDKRRLHAELGELEPALAAHERLISLAPDDAAVIAQKGELLARFGRKAEAREIWAKALRLIETQLRDKKGNENELLRQKIQLLSLSGNAEAAVATASARLDRFAGSVSFLTARCFARAEAGRELELALRDCDEAVRADSGHIEAFEASGLANLRLQRWEAAAADFEAALKLEPRYARAFFGRGIARLRQGRREEGLRDIERAKRYGFDVAADYAAVGIAP